MERTQGERVMDWVADNAIPWMVVGLLVVIGIIAIVVIGALIALVMAPPDCIIGNDGLEYCR